MRKPQVVNNLKCWENKRGKKYIDNFGCSMLGQGEWTKEITEKQEEEAKAKVVINS